MATDTETQRQAGTALYAAISNAIVRCMREYTGRGPMKARTTIRDNVVVVMLEDTLTKGEQVLLKNGRGENVLALRHEYQEAMREESSDMIAELTGRKVIAFMLRPIARTGLMPPHVAYPHVLNGNALPARVLPVHK